MRCWVKELINVGAHLKVVDGELKVFPSPTDKNYNEVMFLLDIYAKEANYSRKFARPCAIIYNSGAYNG